MLRITMLFGMDSLLACFHNWKISKAAAGINQSTGQITDWSGFNFFMNGCTKRKNTAILSSWEETG